ncbi:hypothetical protein SK571_16895 [Lentzea sp. BCCO 10_0798]|uniref:Uncharacterized protein n=1 Tax=Lentzea kristufekii TaxID=3095430 RepID=A0ABU4TS03_9PSEU|nr:hypothetical protein [Lentzea sp. BCCO 10_0798]MDX8051066.1 hypothetical protein [Lentzea sp. BCCO 10_0798]
MTGPAQNGPTHNEFSGHAREVFQFQNLVGPLNVFNAPAARATPRRPRFFFKRAASESGPVHRRIGLWGPAASGKTCFLTALNVAAAQASPPWAMAGTTDSSREFLTRATATMVGSRSFPGGTSTGTYLYDWLLTGELPGRRLLRRTGVRSEFSLTIMDAAGENFVSASPRSEMWPYLASCDGLVYFFDPLSPCAASDHTVLWTLDRLEAMCRHNPGTGDRRLPHKLAVCIAKADKPEIMAAARRHGLVKFVVDPTGRPLPAVHPDDAERFFDLLCDSMANGSGELIRHAIRRYFRPERVRYFATSSIGFYQDSTPDDLYNVVRDGTSARLRGPIRPFNVLEPILWLQAPK